MAPPPTASTRSPSFVLPRLEPPPGTRPCQLTGPSQPAHRRPEPPEHCRRDTPWPPSPCSRGAPTSGLPSSKLSPGIAPRPPPEAHRPLHCSPSPTGAPPRRNRPPPAAALRGAADSEHPSHHRDLLRLRLDLLSLFPNFSPTSGASPRRKTAPETLPCSVPSARGLDAKVRFLFLLFSKTANL